MLDALAGAPSIYDLDYLRSNIEGGEGFDWFYASEADRAAQDRTPITDGLGKPWVFRFKESAVVVVEPAFQPAGRHRERRARRLGSREQADPLHRGRLPGDRQGHQPAERVLRPEILGILRAVFLARLP